MQGRKLYSIAAPVLRSAIWILQRLPRSLSQLMLSVCHSWSGQIGIALRYVLISRLAKSCGQCVAVFEGVYLRGLDQMELGDHVSIHPMCYIDASGGLEIGSEVSIAHATTVMTTDHDYRHPQLPIRRAPVLGLPVRIGSNVWIGCGVRVLAGATIGSNSVIGAGAVVTASVPDNSVAVGVPARPKRFEKRNAA